MVSRLFARKERRTIMSVCGNDALRSLRFARIFNPAREAATVSGGDSTVASIAPVIKAASLSGAPPLTRMGRAARNIPFFERHTNRKIIGAAKVENSDLLPDEVRRVTHFFSGNYDEWYIVTGGSQ